MTKSQPLHKNAIFLTLVGLVSLFMTLDFLLYTKLEDIEDDDLIVGSGGGDGLRDYLMHKTFRRHRQRQAKQHQQKQQQQAQEQAQDFHHNDDWERLQSAVQKLRQPDPATQTDDLAYDIQDCPFDPPDPYPFTWNVMKVLDNWNPDDTSLPQQSIHQSLCMFDWTNQTDQEKAQNYREHEVPFIVHNFPDTMKAAERWMTPGYLETLLGDQQVRNEHSHNNHFMYWKTKHPSSSSSSAAAAAALDQYVPPTDMVDLTYPQWLEKAQQLQETRRQTQQEHWYFRVNAMEQNHAYLYEELPMFDPSRGKSFTMVHPKEHRGINCRFGMKGIIAEAHYDAHNNFIALMGGQRRYILAHPDQCENMELYPLGHPSARHSRINWSTASIHWRDSDRPFTKAQVNEVVLQAGDLMYLPTFWFHFIVSLNINYQCNSRSGDSKEYEHFISKCGFGPRREYDRKTIEGKTG